MCSYNCVQSKFTWKQNLHVRIKNNSGCIKNRLSLVSDVFTYLRYSWKVVFPGNVLRWIKIDFKKMKRNIFFIKNTKETSVTFGLNKNYYCDLVYYISSENFYHNILTDSNHFRYETTSVKGQLELSRRTCNCPICKEMCTLQNVNIVLPL